MSKDTNFGIANLTEIECAGLRSPFNFTDGHAYHDLIPEFQNIINKLPEIWTQATTTSIPEMEWEFCQAFADLYGLENLKGHDLFSICPTASNSIDIVGAWLASRGMKVGLVEPTFDNLALMLRRRGVDVSPVHESVFTDGETLRHAIEMRDLDAIFLVDPNNPTGQQLSRQELENVIEVCAELDVALIIDKTFRFFGQFWFDDYSCLDRGACEWIVIEDTGKTWPTLDLKVSLMTYSAGIADELREIYEEVYLCISNFALAILREFLVVTNQLGTDTALLNTIRKRRELVAAAVADTPLEILQPEHTNLSVVWLNCAGTGLTDLELAHQLRQAGISILPGRYFYWHHHAGQGQDRVRISLLKPEASFVAGMEQLRQVLQKEKSIANDQKKLSSTCPEQIVGVSG